jgi:hypothetical protein
MPRPFLGERPPNGRAHRARRTARLGFPGPGAPGVLAHASGRRRCRSLGRFIII